MGIFERHSDVLRQGLADYFDNPAFKFAPFGRWDAP
jgi:hypothetical protein